MRALDATLFRFFYGAGSGSLTGLAAFLSTIGGGWALLALLPLFAVARWRRLALALTATVAASGSLVFLVKHAVMRGRPYIVLDGVRPLVPAAPTDPSFPSGHACGSFTVAIFLLVVLQADTGVPRPPRGRRHAVATALFLLALSIAWSRVYLGVHFPGDVTVGALLGTVCGIVGARLYLQGARPPCPDPVA